MTSCIYTNLRQRQQNVWALLLARNRRQITLLLPLPPLCILFLTEQSLLLLPGELHRHEAALGTAESGSMGIHNSEWSKLKMRLKVSFLKPQAFISLLGSAPSLSLTLVFFLSFHCWMKRLSGLMGFINHTTMHLCSTRFKLYYW